MRFKKRFVMFHRRVFGKTPHTFFVQLPRFGFFAGGIRAVYRFYQRNRAAFVGIFEIALRGVVFGVVRGKIPEIRR